MNIFIVNKCNIDFSTPVFSEFLTPSNFWQEQDKVTITKMQSQFNKCVTHVSINLVGTITFLHPLVFSSLFMVKKVCCC